MIFPFTQFLSSKSYQVLKNSQASADYKNRYDPTEEDLALDTPVLIAYSDYEGGAKSQSAMVGIFVFTDSQLVIEIEIQEKLDFRWYLR